MHSLVFALVIALSGCTSTRADDPLESLNRTVYAFNDKADRWVLKPMAWGYATVTPQPLQQGVLNVFSNLADPFIALNNLLQCKPREAGSDMLRFLLNSTIGVAGLFDPAGKAGFEKHREDFGQTLGAWGVPAGPYLIIPFWGPSSPRDGIGDLIGGFALVPRYFSNVRARNIAVGVWIVSKRAQLLQAETLVTGDRYSFIRDAYRQRREFLVNDGVLDDPFMDDF